MDWTKDGRKSFCVILGLVLFLFFFRLGDRALRNPDEGRYAHIASQMVDSGNWMEPRLFGIDYLRKPPLFYWLMAASFKIFGQNEWAARAVPAIFGVMGVLATYFFSRKFFGNTAAAYSALLLAVNPWYLHVSRFLVIDSVFSFFVVLSLYLFYLANSGTKYSSTYYGGFYAAVALAFLAKGVLALILPGLAILFYAVLTRQWTRLVKESRLIPGVLIFLLIAGPWFVWMNLHKPDFWNVFFVREHLSRFVAQDFEHQEGWYFYPALVVAFLSPWILFPGVLRNVQATVRKDGFKNPTAFFLFFVFFSVLFLSLSRSKLATYILPVIAPFCVVLGAAWAGWVENSSRRLKIFCSFFFLMAVSAYGVIFAMEIVNPEYSSKPFGLWARSEAQAGEPVFVYDHPGPFYDFRFYFRHPVRPVGLEGELELCREDAKAKKIAVTRQEFQALLAEGAHFYCLIRRSDWHDIPAEIQPKLKILMQNERKLLFESGVL